MTDVEAPQALHDGPIAAPERRPRDLPIVEGLAALVVAAVVLRPFVADHLRQAQLQNATTIFVAVSVQAMPFLVLGVVLSGLIAAFVSPAALAKALPRNPALAVPVAGIAGACLPGCECSSVPIAGRLVSRGAPAAPALTFLLAAPAINPVVLVATAVAFPGRPSFVLARLVASLLAAVVVGWTWARFGDDRLLDRARRDAERSAGQSPWATFADTALHDFAHAGGYLVVGGLTAATLQTVVPKSVLDSVAGHGVTAVVSMAALAVVLAVCSEADAFVASGLTQFSLTARLTFLVVGPMVDVKLIALQVGTFGKGFALRFAPLTLVVAVASACLVGTLLL